jgi:Domain of unknown function (DUF4136)
MTARRTFGILVLLLMLASALASAQKVTSDYNHDYKLSGLQRFAFAPVSPQDPLSKRPDVAEKIKSDLKAQLEKAGFTEDDQNPNFLVEYSASKHVYSDSYSTTTNAWTAGSQVWNTEYTTGTLLVDFLDPQSKQPFWRGTATETVYAGTLLKYVPKGVQKLVQAFQEDARKQKG